MSQDDFDKDAYKARIRDMASRGDFEAVRKAYEEAAAAPWDAGYFCKDVYEAVIEADAPEIFATLPPPEWRYTTELWHNSFMQEKFWPVAIWADAVAKDEDDRETIVQSWLLMAMMLAVLNNKPAFLEELLHREGRATLKSIADVNAPERLKALFERHADSESVKEKLKSEHLDERAQDSVLLLLYLQYKQLAGQEKAASLAKELSVRHMINREPSHNFGINKFFMNEARRSVSLSF